VGFHRNLWGDTRGRRYDLSNKGNFFPRSNAQVSSEAWSSTLRMRILMTNQSCRERLIEDVVIFEHRETQKTGAQSIRSRIIPRAQRARGGPLPARLRPPGRTAHPPSHRVEQVSLSVRVPIRSRGRLQSNVRSGRGLLAAGDTTKRHAGPPSIFAEDREHDGNPHGARTGIPNAWSQAHQWGTSTSSVMW